MGSLGGQLVTQYCLNINQLQFALILTTIITLLKGFDAFMPFKADTFIT